MLPPPNPCTKCIIDGGGALPAAAAALAITSKALAKADNKAFRTLTAEQQDQIHALSEVDCRRAAKIRQWTEEMRLARTEIYGGEYEGTYEISIDGITKKG